MFYGKTDENCHEFEQSCGQHPLLQLLVDEFEFFLIIDVIELFQNKSCVNIV